jgi:hypothetical protein
MYRAARLLQRRRAHGCQKSKTAEVDDPTHVNAGPFALQYGSGVVKFRKVQIKL